MKRIGTKVKKIGTVSFSGLPSEIQEDVVASIRTVTQDVFSDIWGALEKAILPLVEVDPSQIYDPNRRTSEMTEEAYAKAMKKGVDFPPVIIDSSVGPAAALIEGGHRTAAAESIGLEKIKAIDIAGVRIVKLDGVETYDFKLARRERHR